MVGAASSEVVVVIVCLLMKVGLLLEGMKAAALGVIATRRAVTEVEIRTIVSKYCGNTVLVTVVTLVSGVRRHQRK